MDKLHVVRREQVSRLSMKEKEFKELIQSRLKIGTKYNLYPRKISRGVKGNPDDHEDRVKKMTLVAFYPNFALFQDRSGQYETFKYVELYRNFWGGDDN